MGAKHQGLHLWPRRCPDRRRFTSPAALPERGAEIMLPDDSDIPTIDRHSIAVPLEIAKRSRRSGGKLERIISLKEANSGVLEGQKIEIYVYTKFGGVDFAGGPVVVTVSGDVEIGYVLESRPDVVEGYVHEAIRSDYLLCFHDRDLVYLENVMSGTHSTPNVSFARPDKDD